MSCEALRRGISRSDTLAAGALVAGSDGAYLDIAPNMGGGVPRVSLPASGARRALGTEDTPSVEIGKLIQVGNSIALCIPKPYLRSLGWWRGTRVALLAEDGGLVVKSLEDYVITTRKTSSNRGAGELTGITGRARLPKR